jgi:hypothetical protein
LPSETRVGYDAPEETVMIELTEQQQRELAEAGWPPRVLNPRTQETFVLLRAEMFERVRAILEEEDEIATVEEMYPLVSEALNAGEQDAAAKKESS